MKPLSSLGILLCFALLSSCFASREYPVEYDYNYKGKFADLSTFSFVQAESGLKPAMKSVIERTVRDYMQLLGYEYVNSNAEILINYTYMPDSLSYRGYDQPDILQYVKKIDNEDKQKEAYYKKDLQITGGTLVISLTQEEDYAMIWQGYTTDLYADDLSTDPRKVRIAVMSILKNYLYKPELN